MLDRRLAIVIWWAVMLAGGLTLAAWLVAVPWPAWAHDPYSTWQQPDVPGMSCCNRDDCRPTRAYLGDDGRWRAWDGLGWLVVPPGKMLPTDLAGDGRSHLCERGGRVLCFTPGQVRG